MKLLTTIFCLTLVSLHFSVQSFAQGAIPPKNSFVTVDSKECQARFLFPKGYLHRSAERDAYGIKITEQNYAWSNATSRFDVQCGTHPFQIDDVDMQKVHYEFISNGLVQPNSENVEWTNIEKDGHKVRVVDYFWSRREHHYRIYAFIVGDIRYQITVASLNPTKANKVSQATDAAISSFFQGFELTSKQNPVAKTFEESLPVQYFGEKGFGVYKNSAFGFEMKVPFAWSEVPRKELESAIIEKYRASNQLYKTTFVRQILYLLNSRLPSEFKNGLMISIEKPPYRGTTASRVAEQNRDNIMKIPGTRLVEDVRSETVNGTNFSTFVVEAKVDGIMMLQKAYIVVIKGYSLIFLAQSIEGAPITEVISYVNSIKFAE